MSFHLYDIVELYSNADGSVQFIELRVGNFNGESLWQGKTITVSRGSELVGGGGGYGGGPGPVTDDHSFVFPSNLPSTATANTSVLIATQAFADLGIVTPDFIVPSGFLFLDGGTVNFAGADSVTYSALPTDGIHSLSRSGATVTNSPKNFSGDSGTVPGNPIVGTDGADSLVGTAAKDYIVGKRGDDIIDGKAGIDTLKGGPGNDTYVVNSASDEVIEAAGAGTDQIKSTVTLASLPENVENVWLLGSAALDATGNALPNVLLGNSAANTLQGGAGSDTLKGKAGADSLDGGDGDDTLVGGKGNDVLEGGAGNDTLKGGPGSDTLSGGEGADIFHFNKALGGSNRDTIQDFSTGEDVIRLDDDVFSELVTAPGLVLDAAEFAANADGIATEISHRIIYNTATGDLFYDSDGSGSNAPVLFATLAGAPNIDESDFLVIG